MDQAPTWRETGRFLTPAELGRLDDDERVDYYARSNISSFDEIDAMPEPHRSAFKRLVAEQQQRLLKRQAS